jgi:hypothetical protein
MPVSGPRVAGWSAAGLPLDGPGECGLGTVQDSKNAAAATVQNFLNTNIFPDLLN